MAYDHVLPDQQFGDARPIETPSHPIVDFLAQLDAHLGGTGSFVFTFICDNVGGQKLPKLVEPMLILEKANVEQKAVVPRAKAPDCCGIDNGHRCKSPETTSRSGDNCDRYPHVAVQASHESMKSIRD